MHRLAQHLEGLDVRVVALGAADARSFDRDGSLDVVRVPLTPRLGQHAAIVRLNARSVTEAVRFRPDVVLSAHINVAPAALTSRRLSKVPYVQYVHGREAVIRPRLTRAGLGGAAAVIAVSSYAQGLALRFGAPTEPTHQIPPGIDLYRAPVDVRASRPTIVTVARLEQRYKGHDVLIRALALVRARLPDVRLVVIGDGPLRPVYERLARSLGLDGTVEFRGAVDDDARDRALDEAHVFAMPSRLPSDGGGEGFGMVYLEAAVHGLPTVAGDVAGAVDAIEHGRTGLLVDPRDHVAVAGALTTLLEHPAEAEALGRAAAKRAEDFSWPRIGERVAEVLLSVVR
jgi:phosphatidylinositol alpha-1,6-mannosyltransferase